jgi:hypothetical protein
VSVRGENGVDRHEGAPGLARAALPHGAGRGPTDAFQKARVAHALAAGERRCKAVALGTFPPYPWPLAPFGRQHPVRGRFGDPRTIIAGNGEGRFSFHNGVDIDAWTGNHVFPVVSGAVSKVGPDEVVVRAADGRRFQYVHIAPLVRLFEPVTASRTLLGTIRPGCGHVHLSEIRDGCAVNPLLAGHLAPYRDPTSPKVRAILFEGPGHRRLSPLALSGRVQVVAEAIDEPALPNPSPWGSMPLTPALVVWRLTTAAGRVVRSGTAADFRFGEPLRRAFCKVYAPGARQNFAAVTGRLHWTA